MVTRILLVPGFGFLGDVLEQFGHTSLPNIHSLRSILTNWKYPLPRPPNASVDEHNKYAFPSTIIPY